MRVKTYTFLQKLSAELRRIRNNSSGAALSVIMVGIVGIFAGIIIMLLVFDISIYSYKKRMIGSAINYAVSAAVQEIDTERSRKGLSEAFTEDGQVSLTGIYIDEVKADKAFTSTMTKNVTMDMGEIQDKMVRVVATPESAGVYYNIKDKSGSQSGHTDSMVNLEGIINNKMSIVNNKGDQHFVYVNGNAASNSFEKRPYYMVFIRDFEIDGIITRRKATFICFKSAKIYR